MIKNEFPILNLLFPLRLGDFAGKASPAESPRRKEEIRRHNEISNYLFIGGVCCRMQQQCTAGRKHFKFACLTAAVGEAANDDRTHNGKSAAKDGEFKQCPRL